GAHLALSLERLAALCGDTLLRIGLSATQNPGSAIAEFLVGTGAAAAPSFTSPRVRGEVGLRAQHGVRVRGRDRQSARDGIGEAEPAQDLSAEGRSGSPHPDPLPAKSGERGGKAVLGSHRAAQPDVAIIDIGHHRTRDLGIEVPPAPLEAVMSAEVWLKVY